MHVAKWMRKNTKKIMVFVVIFSMVSFVIGYTGLQIFFSLLGKNNPVMGTLSDGEKIRGQDYLAARNELRLLRMLGGDMVLMSQGQQGLAGPLMAYLLFPDSQTVAEAELPGGLKQAAQQGQIPISLELIEEFFSDRAQSELVWILLKAEARKAGSVISDAAARGLLQQLIPQLAQGADASQMIGAIMSETNLTENQIVRAFAELLSVMFYTSNVIDNQLVTLNQIQASIGRSHERFDAEFVEISADGFMDADSPVDAAQLRHQFEAYKTVLPGTTGPDNPFGFGYKLPKRVQLEYMAVMLDDVKTQIERPTAEQLEDFYSRNIDRFRDQEPADPAEPDGEQVTRTRTFAESLPQIRTMIEQERINRLANQIFIDAKTTLDQAFATVDFEQADTAQLQAAAGDYSQAAAELSQRYNINVLTGRTGLLSAADFGRDNVLQVLRLQHSRRFIPLSEIVFNVRLDPTETRRRIGVPSIRTWENIGPMSGGFFDPDQAKSLRLMTMVRVVDVEPASVPETMDVSWDTKGMVIAPSQQRDAQAATFSLAEQVANDLRKVKAMDNAEQVAQELAALIHEHGWEEAIAAFNQKLDDDLAISDVALETVRQQTRMSKTEKDTAQLYITANPAHAEFFKDRLNTSARNERIYRLLPNSEQATGTITEVVGVEQTQAYYVVRNVTRVAATETDYLDNKTMMAFQLNTMASAEPALIHLMTRNLFDRLGYEESDEMPVIQDPAPMLPAEGGF